MPVLESVPAQSGSSPHPAATAALRLLASRGGDGSALNPARAPSAPAAAAHPGSPAGTAAPEHLIARCMAPMLDEIDYGMLLVDAERRVLYLNHTARLECDAGHPLRLGAMLGTAHAADAAPLAEALAAAQRGLRRLVALGVGENRVGISVVPLPGAGDAAGPVTLLVLGKRRVCEQLSVQGFARAVGLTGAETRVLELLCAGVNPTEVAREQGVAVSTVRTQIGSIRLKTGAPSIRDLVRQVAVLPPLVGALRGSAALPLAAA